MSERDEQPERGWLFRGFVSAARRAAFKSGIHNHDTTCVAPRPPLLGTWRAAARGTGDDVTSMGSGHEGWTCETTHHGAVAVARAEPRV